MRHARYVIAFAATAILLVMAAIAIPAHAQRNGRVVTRNSAGIVEKGPWIPFDTAMRTAFAAAISPSHPVTMCYVESKRAFLLPSRKFFFWPAKHMRTDVDAGKKRKNSNTD